MIDIDLVLTEWQGDHAERNFFEGGREVFGPVGWLA
jgi:hypothetical protein